MTHKMPKSYTTLDECIQALEVKLGFVTEAAKALNISYQALSKRIKKNKKLRDALDAINERKLDFSESKLQDLVKKNNLGAICFHLKCKGKHRGWVERTELTGPDGGDQVVTLHVIYDKKETNGT